MADIDPEGFAWFGGDCICGLVYTYGGVPEPGQFDPDCPQHGDTDEQTLRHLQQIAEDALLPCMGREGLLGIVFSRGDVPRERLMKLTSDDVGQLYDDLVGPAVDRLEEALTD